MFENASEASWLASLPVPEQEQFLASLSRNELEVYDADWNVWARRNQLPPQGTWRTWLLLAGRGFGKTRTGAEYVRDLVIKQGRRRIALVAPTAGDARDVMVEGESGILSIGLQHERPLYEPSKRRLTWPNGAIATTYSADEPERLRGPQHDAAWCDEIASWRYPEAWDMLMFGLRLGDDPRVVVTTTPKPIKIIRELLSDPTTAITRGSTYDNRVNLAPAFLEQIVRKYEGTRLGRQELNAEVLDDVPGALWNRERLEELRWPIYRSVPDLVRIVVAIDPAVTSGEDADETGIIVTGKDAGGHGYVLADRSGHYTPTEWAQVAISLYRQHKADRIVAEVNNGGDMVEATIRMVDGNVPFTAVHASRGKVVRAEPVAALYEQEPGRVFHVGTFPTLEDQMCFPRGTLVETTHGHVPIERVEANDLVVTRRGPKRVKIALETGCSCWFVVLETTSGRRLRCTPNHPIYDATNRRFVPAMNVRPGLLLAVRPDPESMVPQWLGEADGTIECRQDITATCIRDYCTEKFGKSTTARYLSAITSIMPTRIARAISCGIWSLYLQRSMTADTNPAASVSLRGSNDQRSIRGDGRGASGWNLRALSVAFWERRRSKPGASSAARRVGESGNQLEKSELRRAQNAGAISWRGIQEEFIAVSSATIEHTIAESVYNIEVEDAQEYYANGVLVHNCGFTTDFDRKMAGFSPDRVDALVWALTDLLVEPVPGEAILSYYRERAREAEERKAAAAENRHPAF